MTLTLGDKSANTRPFRSGGVLDREVEELARRFAMSQARLSTCSMHGDLRYKHPLLNVRAWRASWRSCPGLGGWCRVHTVDDFRECVKQYGEPMVISQGRTSCGPG